MKELKALHLFQNHMFIMLMNDIVEININSDYVFQQQQHGSSKVPIELLVFKDGVLLRSAHAWSEIPPQNIHRFQSHFMEWKSRHLCICSISALCPLLPSLYVAECFSLLVSPDIRSFCSSESWTDLTAKKMFFFWLKIHYRILPWKESQYLQHVKGTVYCTLHNGSWTYTKNKMKSYLKCLRTWDLSQPCQIRGIVGSNEPVNYIIIAWEDNSIY